MVTPRILAMDPAAQQLQAGLERALSNVSGDATSCSVWITSKLDESCVEEMGRILTSHQNDGNHHAMAVVMVQPEAQVIRKLLALGLEDVILFDETAHLKLRARLQRWNQIEELLARPAVCAQIIGQSRCWRSALHTVAECAVYSTAPLLITGPTGTGKELMARLLHTLDTRTNKGDLIVVDCTTLSKDLAGSELFGHERGAFTGAASERDGAVSLAHRGTLYLDEVGELPLELQAQLLRVLQEQSYRRVGSSRWQRAEFRIVCATNRDLKHEVKEGRFRSDLYHRLAAVICRTPGLEARVTDIPCLARHAIASVRPDAPPDIAQELLLYLEQRHYSGNVRELMQLMRACLLHHCGVGSLTLSCLPREEREGWLTEPPIAVDEAQGFGERMIKTFVTRALQSGVGLKELGRLVEAAAVDVATGRENTLASAAAALGVTPRALQLRRAAGRVS